MKCTGTSARPSRKPCCCVAPGVMARPTKIFALEVSQEGERLKLSAHEPLARRGKTGQTLRVPAGGGGGRAARHRRHGGLAAPHHRPPRHLEPAVWQDVKATGAALYHRLLTPAIQDKLRASSATDSFLYIDDALVQIPWELLYDGQTFLCRRFSMGRLVSTQQALVERQERRPEQALKMLIIADPQGDRPLPRGGQDHSGRTGQRVAASASPTCVSAASAPRRSERPVTARRATLRRTRRLRSAGAGPEWLAAGRWQADSP